VGGISLNRSTLLFSKHVAGGDIIGHGSDSTVVLSKQENTPALWLLYIGFGTGGIFFEEVPQVIFGGLTPDGQTIGGVGDRVVDFACLSVSCGYDFGLGLKVVGW
jgi:hypothetical protein